jgi:hypothetical protein
MKTTEPESKESAVRARHQIAPADKDRTSLTSALLHLQRTQGNRYVQRLLNATIQRKCDCGGACAGCASDQYAIQTKLTVSQPGDRYEQEADRVAEQVMRMSTEEEIATSRFPVVSRIAQRQEEENVNESDLLSLKEVPDASHNLSPDLETRIESLRGGGQAMPEGLRAFFEPRLGRDLGSVRLHTDASAAETARSINARAFTLGRDIAFAPGEYQPESPEGRRLLAHELTHVVQQNDSSVQTLMRACDCSAVGARDPTSGEKTFLSGKFPNLVSGNWCVSAPATPTYNCFAWSIGNTSKWIDKEVDTVYGDNDGTLEFSDFDDFYSVEGALTPVTNATPADPEVVLYGKGGEPTHAAAKSATPCGFATVESKLGEYVRIIHNARELEGGSVYGDIDRYYI